MEERRKAKRIPERQMVPEKFRLEFLRSRLQWAVCLYFSSDAHSSRGKLEFEEDGSFILRILDQDVQVAVKGLKIKYGYIISFHTNLPGMVSEIYEENVGGATECKGQLPTIFRGEIDHSEYREIVFPFLEAIQAERKSRFGR